MLVCDNIVPIVLYAMKIMKWLQLVKFEKVLVSEQRNYTYLSSNWFRSKPNKGSEYKSNKVQESNNVYIEHVSLIIIKFKQGKLDSIENYRGIDIFRKY